MPAAHGPRDSSTTESAIGVSFEDMSFATRPRPGKVSRETRGIVTRTAKGLNRLYAVVVYGRLDRHEPQSLR
jgi:hypothetical protein